MRTTQSPSDDARPAAWWRGGGWDTVGVLVPSLGLVGPRGQINMSGHSMGVPGQIQPVKSVMQGGHKLIANDTLCFPFPSYKGTIRL